MSGKGAKVNQKMSPGSPSKFIKPFEVFLMRKKRPQIVPSPTKGLPARPAFSPLKCLDTNSPAKATLHPAKSPFKLRKTPIKKSQTENYIQVPADKLPSKSPLKVKTPSRTTKRQLNFNGYFSGEKARNATPVINLDEETNLEAPTKKLKLDEGHEKLPIDWSLKTRIRFVSSKPFPWRGNFRASEDAAGTSSFVRCLHSSLDESGPVASSASNLVSSASNSSPSQRTQPIDTSLSAVLRQHSFVWSHPHLPWLSLFPRINVVHPSVGSGKSMPSFQFDPQSHVAESLRSDWISSLRSLYHLVKTRQCAFFYICANTFTVLFRSAGVAGVDQIHAMVTPTTSGFRALLDEEGISFSLPFADQNGETSFEETPGVEMEASQQPEEVKEEFKIVEDVDEDHTVFLESLGLSQQDFPSLSCKRIKINKTNKNTKRESLALIVGSDTQLLINFLSNSRVSISNTGHLTAVPPTLLSPVAFHGATLQPLKLKQTKSTYNNENIHNLDICGPILPSAVKGLCDFFRGTQDGNYRSNLITHEPTSQFALSSSKMKSNAATFSAFATESLKDCGLSCDLVGEFCSKESQSSDVLGDIILKDNVYQLR